MTQERPAIGQWYQEGDGGALFEVVARDERAGTIEVQYLDGEIAEFDRETWRELPLVLAEEPEDWRSPYELSAEDGVDPDLPLHPLDWSNPLSRVEPDTVWSVDGF
jgi:hypothetical protein